MLHSIPLLLPTYYIKLLIFQKAYREYIGILAIHQELYLDTTMPMIKDPLYFF